MFSPLSAPHRQENDHGKRYTSDGGANRAELTVELVVRSAMPITVGTLGRLRAVHQHGRDVVFSFESSELRLTPILPNVIRHTWVPTHWRLYAARVTDSYAVIRDDWPTGPVAAVSEPADTVRVQMGELLVEATRDPFHLRYFTADGRLLLEE